MFLPFSYTLGVRSGSTYQKGNPVIVR